MLLDGSCSLQSVIIFTGSAVCLHSEDSGSDVLQLQLKPPHFRVPVHLELDLASRTETEPPAVGCNAELAVPLRSRVQAA